MGEVKAQGGVGQEEKLSCEESEQSWLRLPNQYKAEMSA